MKTLIKIFIFVVLLFSVGLTQQKSSVNGWSLNGFHGSIDSEKTKTETTTSAQLFSTYGYTQKNGGWYIHSNFVKTFGSGTEGNNPLVPDSLAVRLKYAGTVGKIERFCIRIGIQDPYAQYFSGYETKIYSDLSSWQEFKFDMNVYIKTFMKYIFRLYLEFLIVSPDSGYVGANVAVSRLWGIDDTLGIVVYDYFGDSPTGVEIEQIPTEFALYQNYPNPFNPSTTISYQLAIAGMVTIRVYDVLGKEVATVVNEIKHAGKHSVEFNASGLTSGIYFYRIQAGNFMQIKKMIFMK